MSGRIVRKRWPQWIAFAAIVLLASVGWWLEAKYLPDTGWRQPRGQLTAGEYNVERVIDGDTIVLKQAALRVRMQGVDTPETTKVNTPVEAWGPEATAYTEQFLQDANWRVRLEINGEPVDRYGRHLAFVWYENRLLNEELVQQGLARAKLTFNFSRQMKDRLLEAQNQAQTARRGIWSE